MTYTKLLLIDLFEGNTCYMNATLQCLKGVPELCDTLKQYTSAGGSLSAQRAMIDGTQMITNALKSTFQQLDLSSDPHIPLNLLSGIHREFPRFAEKDDHGHLMQQDANEFWVQLVQVLQMNLPGRKSSNGSASAADANTNFVDQFFGIKTQSM